MARILSIQADIPDKTFGGRKRVFHLTEALVRAGHDLHMLVELHESDLSKLQILQDMGVTCHPVFFKTARPTPVVTHPIGKYWQKVDNAVRFRRSTLRAIGKPLPKAAHPHWLGVLRKRLQELMQQEKFDLIIIENEENTQLSLDVPQGVPLLIDVQNVLSTMIERELKLHAWHEIFDLYHLSERVQPAKLKRLESAMVKRYTSIVAMSELEAAHLRRGVPEHLASRVHVVENGVDTTGFQTQGAPSGQDRVIFTGLMSYAPNVDAMKWFLSDIWPQVLAARPHAHLDIVGADPTPEIHALAAPFSNSVHITGRVPEVQPYFEKANVVVVPLRAGGGTRLKILEAAAMRRPMVSTRVGAEGLTRLRDGEEILLRDTPQDFAASVVQLLEDRALSERLAQSARQVVEDHYSWDLIGRKFERLVSQACLSSVAE